MQQLDLFDETIQKKILRMEKWMGKINQQISLYGEEMILIRKALNMHKKCAKIDMFRQHIDEIDMFGVQ